jgi:hypothetical protein
LAIARISIKDSDQSFLPFIGYCFFVLNFNVVSSLAELLFADIIAVFEFVIVFAVSAGVGQVVFLLPAVAVVILFPGVVVLIVVGFPGSLSAHG